MTHPRVPHPNHLLPAARFNDWVAAKLTRLLGSAMFFYACFVVPLVAIPAPDWFKTIVIIVSSNWIQLWALSVLQMGQNRAEAERAAKADADHQALTHVALTADHADRMVTALAVRLGLDPVTGEDRKP